MTYVRYHVKQFNVWYQTYWFKVSGYQSGIKQIGLRYLGTNQSCVKSYYQLSLSHISVAVTTRCWG